MKLCKLSHKFQKKYCRRLCVAARRRRENSRTLPAWLAKSIQVCERTCVHTSGIVGMHIVLLIVSATASCNTKTIGLGHSNEQLVPEIIIVSRNPLREY